jgi:rhamnosyltransferase
MKHNFSIIIPVFNSGKYLKSLINKIFTAKGKFNIEVVVLDSGSTDKTRSTIKKLQKKYRNIIYKYQESVYFNHGLTRNLGVRLSSGRFVLFMSVDAFPKSNNFLDVFYKVLSTNKKIIACYGKEVPRSTTPFIQKLDTIMFYEELDSYTEGQHLLITKSKIMPPRLKYSLNNVFSVYRRSYLVKYPFPKILYGEDFVVGKKIIGAGYEVAYIPECVVVHSHDFTLVQYFQRQTSDFRFKYKTAKLDININFFKKAKYISSLKKNFLVKIHSFLKLIGYYLIKILALLCSYV